MNKVKDFLKKYWGLFKATKVFRFLKKWGLQIINLLVFFVAYSAIDENSFRGLLVGLWIFLLLGYYIFWKIAGAESLLKKDED
jgi:hypothetical protein